MGLRLAEGIDPARYAALAGRPLDPERIAILHDEGAVETTPDGRLRVTQSGFPVLDAVVADLAASVNSIRSAAARALRAAHSIAVSRSEHDG